jgi:hypothetical protein
VSLQRCIPCAAIITSTGVSAGLDRAKKPFLILVNPIGAKRSNLQIELLCRALGATGKMVPRQRDAARTFQLMITDCGMQIEKSTFDRSH